MCSGIGSLVLISPISGFRKRILRRLPSIGVSTVSPFNNPYTTRMYSSISASLTAPRPIARRAEKPVPMPKSMRPGASPFQVANAFAVTAAMRFDGTKTPVPSRMREVLSVAAAIATKQSPVIICVSKNQAWVNPSSSARCASFHESLAVAMPIPKSIFRLPASAGCGRLLERPLEEPQHLWAHIGAKAPGFVHRVNAPEMTGARHDDRAREKAGLLQRGKKLLGLRGRVDDIVFAAVDQKETGAVLINRRVAERRGLEEDLSAHHRWAAEQFLYDLVARPGDLVVLPLREHIVDAVKADDRFHIGRGSGMAIAEILARE